MKKEKIIIYTDGSSLGNPGPGGYGAVIVFLGQDKVLEIGGAEDNTTNNRMEMTAVIESLISIKDIQSETTIYSDSSYLLNGVTKWIYGWEKNNWQTSTKQDVLNQDLWKRLLLVLKDRKNNGKIIWKKVKGHAGILGNERADIIATSFSEHGQIVFAHGSVSEYEKVFGGKLVMPDSDLGGSPQKSSSKAKALFYLSMVDGIIEKHQTWADCEARVRGRSGAKYKKITSESEALEIIKSWKN